jgi:hypothetical protein
MLPPSAHTLRRTWLGSSPSLPWLTRRLDPRVGAAARPFDRSLEPWPAWHRTSPGRRVNIPAVNGESCQSKQRKPRQNAASSIALTLPGSGSEMADDDERVRRHEPVRSAIGIATGGLQGPMSVGEGQIAGVRRGAPHRLAVKLISPVWRDPPIPVSRVDQELPGSDDPLVELGRMPRRRQRQRRRPLRAVGGARRGGDITG